MKVQELFETVSEKPASPEDLDWSISKIKEVKADIDELATKDKYNPEKQMKASDKREAKRWISIFDEARWRMDFAIKLHQKIIPDFNKIKALANKALNDGDVETAKKCLQDFKALVIDNDLIKISKRVMHRDATKLKVERNYPKKINDAIQWILHVRDETPKLILRASRSEEENKRADKLSSSMKARWGSY